MRDDRELVSISTSFPLNGPPVTYHTTRDSSKFHHIYKTKNKFFLVYFFKINPFNFIFFKFKY